MGKHPCVCAHPLVAVVEREVARTGAGGGCSSGGSVRTYDVSIRARRWLHSPAASHVSQSGPRQPWNERDTEQGGTQTMHELQLGDIHGSYGSGSAVAQKGPYLAMMDATAMLASERVSWCCYW